MLTIDPVTSKIELHLSSFFGRVRKLQKGTINFIVSVCLFVRMENSAAADRIFMKFDSFFYFSKIC